MASQKYLICDCVGSASLEIMQMEGAGSSSGPLRFRGKFQEANVQNKNNRMYGIDILSREVERLNPIISERRLFGELDHPDNSVIHLENASHLITKLWWNGNILMGEGEILPTPAGRILESVVRAGIPVGVSSRGVGNGKTNGNGIMIIEPDFRMITFDVVADPSTPEAFASAIGENKSFYKNVQPVKSESKNVEKNNTKRIYNTNNTKLDADVVISYINALVEENVKY